MKKIFVLIVAFILCTASVFAKDIKFAQITDIYYRGSSDVMDKIIRDINKTPDIDFVVFTGNNLGRPSENNLKRFLIDAKRLNKPFYVVLGNKDVSKTHNLDKKTYMSMVKRYNKLHPKTTNYTFKKGDIVFVVVDGSKELIPSMNGFYNKETIDWVDKQLNKYSKNKIVILQHFPLVNKPNNEFYYTYNILEYMQMLSKHNNVIAVVTGHYNKNDEVMYNGVYHITSPRSAEGTYKIIDIDVSNGNSVYTVLKDIK
ncbi:MAG: metallophosphoesterase [Cyanobacteria bacterium RUI128]|nr:metallophosphoesterase [Cyanobacteria bacterium RUI128]